MRIGDLARQARVTTKAVRYYESLGLITPDRLANGYRDYTDNDVRLVREIRNLGQLGIPVERTRPFLECLAAGGEHGDDCPSSMAGYREAIDDLTRRIDGLTARRAVLTAHLRASAYRNSIATPDGGEPMTRTHEQLPPGLPVPEDDGAADHLPGLALPGLALTATDGRTVRLDELGPGRTVIYLYPLTGRPDVDLPEGWDAIPGARGCTPESCGFRDHHQELLEAGAERVFGLSSQDSAYQREVVERLGLPFSMLSDPGLSLADALGLPTFSAGGGPRLFKRLTMVVRDGRIEHVFYPVFPPDAHAGEVLGWLRGSA
ncbi:peroxiredoxin [Streptomyces eurocidicus]|uniref:Peroxiredoxin n=1 Tax=Streptomyces eurocidicus TaxID=66423 RepID=A0A2N8P3B1_STREU|nr:MerR family transcriptional regulator [Streptomyces eurocidicus]MBB5117711.1 peroxiredoxin/DNA-binding transcriptional MerR regulator [Streptomyces eurocidicus]MBF6053546.1 redoxin family protein [Streptomyces eurocidicus]PNE35507.1 peroxiredoxin [Streptomyces eurocidicus]